MAKSKPGGANSNKMTIQRQDQDTGKSVAVVFAIVGAIIGTLMWRSRKTPKEDSTAPTTSHPKGKISPAKTAGTRRVNKKTKGKKRKAEEKPPEPSKKEKGGGGESVVYTNHRYFQNPNGAAIPIAAPVSKPKDK